MEGLKAIPYIALVLAISGIILGASVIVTTQFGDTVTKCFNASWAYNTATNRCLNATPGGAFEPAGKDSLNFSDTYYSINKATSSEGTIASQLPTVAIIGVMVVIISIIAGVFVYMRYFA